MQGLQGHRFVSPPGKSWRSWPQLFPALFSALNSISYVDLFISFVLSCSAVAFWSDHIYVRALIYKFLFLHTALTHLFHGKRLSSFERGLSCGHHIIHVHYSIYYMQLWVYYVSLALHVLWYNDVVVISCTQLICVSLLEYIGFGIYHLFSFLLTCFEKPLNCFILIGYGCIFLFSSVYEVSLMCPHTKCARQAPRVALPSILTII